VLTNVTLVHDHGHMDTQTNGPKNIMPLKTVIAGEGKTYSIKHSHTETAQTTPEPPTGGPRGKSALSQCKGGPERALLVVKGHVRWCKGTVRLERAT